MQHFAITAKDKENSRKIRLENREAHLEYIKNTKIVNIKLAGPLLDDEDKMFGSTLVIEAENIDKINEFLANDPYNKAGLFADIVINRFKLVIS